LQFCNPTFRNILINKKLENIYSIKYNFMKQTRMFFAMILSSTLIFSGCASWNKTTKGAVIGTAAGGAMGAVIGKAAGNTAMGAIIGAAVGGGTGAVIGHQMDKQAEEIKKAVPDAKVERVGEGIVVEFNSNVLFGFDQSNLSVDAKSNLDNLVKVLNSYPDTDIEVQGHTDSKGSESYNNDLSFRRAAAVSGYLTSNSIKGSRVKINGFGESAPKYDNSTSEGRAQNRRVEFLIAANEKMKEEAAKTVSE
jgi:outer membrane protein OmpA-like peptidoglycan-associated protein